MTKRMIINRLTALYPGKSASFRNDVVFHVLAFMSAKEFTSPAHAAAGWRSKTPDQAAVDEAIETVMKLFEEAGGTDRVAKSPSFQKTVLAASSKASAGKVKPCRAKPPSVSRTLQLT